MATPAGWGRGPLDERGRLRRRVCAGGHRGRAAGALRPAAGHGRLDGWPDGRPDGRLDGWVVSGVRAGEGALRLRGCGCRRWSGRSGGRAAAGVCGAGAARVMRGRARPVRREPCGSTLRNGDGGVFESGRNDVLGFTAAEPWFGSPPSGPPPGLGSVCRRRPFLVGLAGAWGGEFPALGEGCGSGPALPFGLPVAVGWLAGAPPDAGWCRSVGVDLSPPAPVRLAGGGGGLVGGSGAVMRSAVGRGWGGCRRLLSGLPVVAVGGFAGGAA